MSDCKLSTFLATFPTQLQFTENKNSPNLRVFWSQTEPSKSNTSSDFPDSWMIHEKIKSAFSNIYLPHLNGLIQFWAPVKTNGRRVLTTSAQPFSLDHKLLESFSFDKYRLRCMKYQYDIDVKNKTEVEEKDPLMVISAFDNHLPRVVNLRVHQWSPLVRSALNYQLTTSLLMPVFYTSAQSSCSCVGVIECSLWRSSLFIIFSVLKRELKRVGLSTFHAQECWSYKSICGLKHATDEIDKALEIVCELHGLSLAQVWIAYENEDIQTKPKFAVKLIGHCAGSKNDLKHYYDTCDMFPLKIGEGLPGKALQTYEPRFCRNINEMTDNGLFAALPYITITECSCLVICLRSIDTGDVDYAFEFLWPKSRNYLTLLEALLLTLKSFLPSFKFASGALLGDELRVIDVENSTGSGIGFIEILQGNKLLQLPGKARRLLVEDDCISSSACTFKSEINQMVGGLRVGDTLKRKSNVLESQEHNFVKRKLSDLCESQNESCQEHSREKYEDSANSNNSVKYPVTEELPTKVSSSVCTSSGRDTLKRESNVLESQEHNFSKGKLSDMCESQAESSQENNRENCEDSASSNISVRYPVIDELVMRVKYGNEKILRLFPVSSTFADIKKNISETYNLDPASFSIDYLDSDFDEWMRLDNEFGWENYITYWRKNGYQTIQMLVQNDIS